MTREEELRIVRLVQGGDSASFESLVLDNQTKIYNLALRMVSNEDDAFDMTQEAFIRAYNSIGSFRGDCRFSVWLYRLTTNICLDHLRSASRKAHISLTFDDDESGKELEISDERFCPQNEAEKEELRKAIHRGINLLSPGYRAILLLREIDGLSYSEIGKVLDLEAGTVKSRIFRARKKLCEILLADRNFSYFEESKKREV